MHERLLGLPTENRWHLGSLEATNAVVKTIRLMIRLTCPRLRDEAALNFRWLRTTTADRTLGWYLKYQEYGGKYWASAHQPPRTAPVFPFSSV